MRNTSCPATNFPCFVYLIHPPAIFLLHSGIFPRCSLNNKQPAPSPISPSYPPLPPPQRGGGKWGTVVIRVFLERPRRSFAWREIKEKDGLNVDAMGWLAGKFLRDPRTDVCCTLSNNKIGDLPRTPYPDFYNVHINIS